MQIKAPVLGKHKDILYLYGNIIMPFPPQPACKGRYLQQYPVTVIVADTVRPRQKLPHLWIWRKPQAKPDKEEKNRYPGGYV
jgi:hypothetical protein